METLPNQANQENLANQVMREYERFDAAVETKFGSDDAKLRQLEVAYFANLKISNPEAYSKFQDAYEIDLDELDMLSNEELRELADASDFRDMLIDVRNEISQTKN